jgi:hypothetical protein
MKDTISIEILNWCLRRKTRFRQGDYVVETRQKGVKYLLETLEPEGIDSFFNWNFFDTMLQQRRLLKLCFEDTAAQILKTTRNLKKHCNRKIADPIFPKS